MIKGILLGLVSLVTLVSCQGDSERPTVHHIPVVYSPEASIKLYGLEKFHPFDVKKYDKIYADLKASGCVSEVHPPEVLAEEDLLLVHTAEYLRSLEDREAVATYLEAPLLNYVPGLDVRRSIVEPFIVSSGGTLKAARLALVNEAAINLGGGFHHAMPDRGEGFCIIADVPIAIRKLQQEGEIETALIIDTDIHHGNGTVLCLANDPTTYTFSMHEANIYPHRKPQGDRDVVVHEQVSDDEYLQLLKNELAHVFANFEPDIVFHVAGCDALEGDPLANGMMTHEGIARRDRLVFQACQDGKIPYVMTLSGGYSKGAWRAQSESIKALMR